MKERPILMSAPMVKALLDGRKTQTRRVMKSQPYTLRTEGFGYGTKSGGFVSIQSPHCLAEFPYGVPGDRLWVREAWTSGYRDGAWGTIFRADETFLIGKCAHEKGPHFHAKEMGSHILWRPSIFMPRWASRITLEVTDVRVQRLQEISEGDAVAEGIYRNSENMGAGWRYSDAEPVYAFAASAYRELWESIHGAGSSTLNPWVWAVGFKVVVA